MGKFPENATDIGNLIIAVDLPVQAELVSNETALAMRDRIADMASHVGFSIANRLVIPKEKELFISKPIRFLELRRGAENVLTLDLELNTIGDLLKHGLKSLMEVRGLGETYIREIRFQLYKETGLTFSDDLEAEKLQQQFSDKQ